MDLRFTFVSIFPGHEGFPPRYGIGAALITASPTCFRHHLGILCRVRRAGVVRAVGRQATLTSTGR